MAYIAEIGHHTPNGHGVAIRAQLMKPTKNRGLIVYTFWWDNAITSTDGWGIHGEYLKSDVGEQRAEYARLVSQGYTPVPIVN